MTPELQNLLHRWREGSLTAEEMRALTAELAKPEARAVLRRDWFLDAALPQSLAASSVIVRTPLPSLAARMRAWAASWFTLFAPGDARGEESSILALRLWARLLTLHCKGKSPGQKLALQPRQRGKRKP